MEYPSQPHLGEAKRRSVHHHRARAPRRCWRDHDTRSSSFTAVRESRILRFRHSTRHKQSIMHPSSSFFSTLDGGRSSTVLHHHGDDDDAGGGEVVIPSFPFASV